MSAEVPERGSATCGIGEPTGTINNGWLQKPVSELHCAVSFVSSWRSSSSAARRVYRRQRPAPFPSRVVKSRHQSQLGVGGLSVVYAEHMIMRRSSTSQL